MSGFVWIWTPSSMNSGMIGTSILSGVPAGSGNSGYLP